MGFILFLLALVSPEVDTAPVWACGILAMVVSAKITILDLCMWVKKKHEEELTVAKEVQTRAICWSCREAIHAVTPHADHRVDDNEPPEHKTMWPTKWLMIVEFFLTPALIWLWFCELAVTMNGYSYYDHGSVAFNVYAGMPTLIALVLHAKCWWSALREREKQRWGREHDLEGGCDAAVAATPRPVPGGGQGGTAAMSASTSSNTATGIKDTVQKLNREARGILSSNSWIGVAAATATRDWRAQERQSLLPKIFSSDAKPVSACIGTLGDGTAKGLGSDRQARHGKMAEVEDESDGNGSEEIEPIMVNRQASYLTPSTTLSPTSSPESIDAHPSYGTSTTTLGQSLRAESSTGTVRDLDGLGTPDDPDDAEIMVIKKARKNKQGKRVKQHAEEGAHP